MIQFKKNNLTVYQSSLWKTTSNVFEADDFILITDPTWLPHEINEIKSYVERIRDGKELYLLFTHGDFDHIIGYGAFPDAKVIGSIGMLEHPNKQYKLDLINNFDSEYYIDRPYPIEFPTIDIVIKEDGQQLKIGNTLITFYLSPGHTHDGLFAIIEPQGIWITGDYLSDFELPYLFDSAKAYINTLMKAENILKNHFISVLVPGHGYSTENRDEMNRRIELAREYINRLIESVKNGDSQSIDQLGKEMSYQSTFTKECHEKNIEIIQNEFE
ncbi:glyoxylase-like metal-dependent hydrolase (beta-lactamase superfamily II) [Paenibacillus anaericanus]|uniref:MBL fold metallo-hydrolase n=1 Tax=Paenibacillus anaericanus TaxID=170367 RepID=UPI00278B2F00|nr:MBL fold metallo-hydrolase [Paenibacillus anaericanus]MDQ0088859.1 glyoxylase-like metal-dependent hydrolase (beta-lactamase superfamily II) [Paenibacillus anaericanus]